MSFNSILLKADPSDQKLSKILSYREWRHRIKLSDGMYTPGHIMEEEWELNYLPANLNGKSFLDVGANDGMFSFLAERMGASEIVAVDRYNVSINTMKNGWTGTGIEMAKEYLNSKVQIVNSGIHELDELNKKFDVVYCADVLSWIENIPLAIQKLCEACKGALIIKDGFWKGGGNSPVIRYEVGKPYKYKPNLKFMTTVLEKNGFKKIEIKPLNILALFNLQFETLPMVELKKDTPFFANPYAMQSEGVTASSHQIQATGYLNDKLYIRNIGWVNAKDVIGRAHKKSPAKQILKSIVGTNTLLNIQNSLYEQKQDIGAYTIIASK